MCADTESKLETWKCSNASNIKAKNLLMVRTMPNSKKAKTKDMDSKTMLALT